MSAGNVVRTEVTLYQVLIFVSWQERGYSMPTGMVLG